MAHRRLAWGGLNLHWTATRSGAEIGISFNGRPWHWLFGQRQAPVVVRAAPRSADTPLPEQAPEARAERQALVDSVSWYHTIDLGDGLLTPGQFDHRDLIGRYRLPDDLSGQRVLDVATFDGFWAFEFERRGAAEVVAIDLDRPVDLDLPHAVREALTDAERAVRFGRGFRIASLLRGSAVRRLARSVYALDAAEMGRFDLVHLGDLLPHLAHPVLALQRAAAVCRDQALISEVYFPELEHHGPGARAAYLGGHHDAAWWRLGEQALRRMTLDAGFRGVEVLSRFRYGQRGAPANMNHLVLRAWM